MWALSVVLTPGLPIAMADPAKHSSVSGLVPDEVIPRGGLPAMRYRDLPEPVAFRRMIGPGIILAGLSLGSGEFVFWPYITYKSQFVFFSGRVFLG